MKLDRKRPFGTICGEIYQPPEFDRPAKYEQDGRCFDVHGCEIVPRRKPVLSGAYTPVGNGVSPRRRGALTKEYESLLKLLGGMAQGAYEWNSAQMKCVAATILNDVSAVGLNIDKNAVIELLRQAAQLVAASSGEADLHFDPSALAWCLEDRDILIMLVGAMAKGGYGWCPSQARSETTTDIHNDVLELGLGMDIDTVRKYLKLAAHLPALRLPTP